MNAKVDFYFSKHSTWQNEISYLRTMVLDCGLAEELKWGVPCYTSAGKNLVLIHVFKEYCALLFFKGALLSDPANILVQQTAHVQAARQVRFRSVQEIVELEPRLKSYIYEAIELEKAGLNVELKKTTDFIVLPEFQQQLEQNTALKIAFSALTPGRQRAYLLYFAAPKQSKTRQSRIDKQLPQILRGKGLND